LSATVAEFKPAVVAPLKFDAGKATVNGKLTTDDGMTDESKFYKAFTFQGEKGKAYRFELTGGGKGSGIDPELRIADDKGTIRNEDFGDGKVSRVMFVPAQSAT